MKSLSSMAPSLTRGKEPQAACCMRPCPPDGLPIMGQIPGTANAFVAAGHNCWGILGAVRAFVRLCVARDWGIGMGMVGVVVVVVVTVVVSPSTPSALPLTSPRAYMIHTHTTHQPATGLVMAELVAGQTPSVALDAFSPARFMPSAARRGKKIRGVEVGEQW